MFSKIVNPKTNKTVKVNSKVGENILKTYSGFLNQQSAGMLGRYMPDPEREAAFALRNARRAELQRDLAEAEERNRIPVYDEYGNVVRRPRDIYDEIVPVTDLYDEELEELAIKDRLAGYKNPSAGRGNIHIRYGTEKTDRWEREVAASDELRRRRALKNRENLAKEQKRIQEITASRKINLSDTMNYSINRGLRDNILQKLDYPQGHEAAPTIKDLRASLEEVGMGKEAGLLRLKNDLKNLIRMMINSDYTIREQRKELYKMNSGLAETAAAAVRSNCNHLLTPEPPAASGMFSGFFESGKSGKSNASRKLDYDKCATIQKKREENKWMKSRGREKYDGRRVELIGLQDENLWDGREGVIVGEGDSHTKMYNVRLDGHREGVNADAMNAAISVENMQFTSGQLAPNMHDMADFLRDSDIRSEVSANYKKYGTYKPVRYTMYD